VESSIPVGNPVIDSVTSVWKGADWLERETYDLLGIVFVYLLSRFIDALTNTLKKMMLRNKSCCLQDKYI
jgi:hypothetical protein